MYTIIKYHNICVCVCNMQSGKLYSFHDNIICGVSDDNKLILSKLENSRFVNEIISEDKEFIANIKNLRISPTLLVIHMMDDNVYVYDTVNKTQTKIGKFSVINIYNYGTDIEFYFQFVCKDRIVLFNNNLEKIEEFMFPENEHIIYSGTFQTELLFYVATNTTTYVFDDMITLVKTYPKIYVTMVAWWDIYCCLDENKSTIDVYDFEWKFQTKINTGLIIKKIISSVALSFLDEYDTMYFFHNFESCSDQDRDNILSVFSLFDEMWCLVKFPFDSKCCDIISTCAHIGECECQLSYGYIAYEDTLLIYSKLNGSYFGIEAKNLNINFKNFFVFDKLSSNIFIFIEKTGIFYIYILTLIENNYQIERIFFDYNLKIDRINN